MQIYNQTDEERKAIYFRCVEIGLHNTLLQMSGKSKITIRSNNYEQLKNLLPVINVYGAYSPNNAFIFDNAKTKIKHIEKWDGSEKSRLKAIRKVNTLIDAYNEEGMLNPTPIIFQRHLRYKEWHLNGRLSDRTTHALADDKVGNLVDWDNEFIYKKSLQANNLEDYIPYLNKLIYDYLVLMTPIENREEHVFHKPLLEFENWFMMKGLSIEHTPNLIDIGDGKVISNPLSQRLEETEKAYKESQYEQYNLIKIIKRTKKTHQEKLEKVTRMKPKEFFKQMVDSGEMDTFLKKKGNTFKKSGKVNMSAVAEEIGVSEGKIVKKYFEEYAPRFLKADTEGYTFDDTGDNTIYKVKFKNHYDMYVKKHEIDTIDKRWKVKSIEPIKQAKP